MRTMTRTAAPGASIDRILSFENPNRIADPRSEWATFGKRRQGLVHDPLHAFSVPNIPADAHAFRSVHFN